MFCSSSTCQTPCFLRENYSSLFSVHISIEYEVKSYALLSRSSDSMAKLSCCYTLVLYLRTRGKSEKCALIAPVSLVRTVMSYWRMREGCLVTGVSPLSMRFAYLSHSLFTLTQLFRFLLEVSILWRQNVNIFKELHFSLETWWKLFLKSESHSWNQKLFFF